ncbi:MAG: thymidylate kinase [Clostridiales bacterium]|nr:thymidylate kinase [Clostridiales bacterium]
MGKLIAIDGVDASGKQTHTELLADYLSEKGLKVRYLSFPMYDSPSSEPVKMYLSGKLGNDAGDVDAYCASTLFAADRFVTYRADWHRDYEDRDTVIIADRYVSSNMIHQAGKICDIAEKDKFLGWLYDFEFNIYKLPEPDMTLFLDMPPEYGRTLIKNRCNKFSGSSELDIHERDSGYLEKSYENAKYVAEKFMWRHIFCVKDGKIRSIENIQDEIRQTVDTLFAKG